MKRTNTYKLPYPEDTDKMIEIPEVVKEICEKVEQAFVSFDYRIRKLEERIDRLEHLWGGD